MVVKIRKDVERVLENTDKIRSQTLKQLVSMYMLSYGFQGKWNDQFGTVKKEDTKREDRRKKILTTTLQIEKWLGCSRRTAHDYHLALESLLIIGDISDATFRAMLIAITKAKKDPEYNFEDELTDADDLIDPLVQSAWNRYLEYERGVRELQEKNTGEVQS